MHWGQRHNEMDEPTNCCRILSLWPLYYPLLLFSLMFHDSNALCLQPKTAFKCAIAVILVLLIFTRSLIDIYYTKRPVVEASTRDISSWSPRPGEIIPMPLRIRKYSSYHCVGDSYNNKNDWVTRSCHYQNVCLDKGHLLYFQDPDRAALLPENISVLLAVVGRTHNDLAPFRLLPKIQTREIPADWVYRTGDGGTGVTTVMFSEYNMLGLGHHVSDVLFPIFRLAHMFGLEHYQLQLLHVDDYDTAYTYSCQFFRNQTPPQYVDLCALWPKLSALYTQDGKVWTERSALRNQSVCFSTLLAGVGLLAEHGRDPTFHGQSLVATDINVGLGGLYWAFRKEMIRRLNIDEHAPGRARSFFDVIYHDNFRHRCNVNFTRTDMLLKQLRPKVKTTLLKWSEPTLWEQIDIASRTKVMVSIQGGGAHVGYFMPRHATFFLIWWDTETNGKPSESRGEWYTWNNLGHIKIKWTQSSNVTYHKDTYISPNAKDFHDRYVDEEQLAIGISEALNYFHDNAADFLAERL